MLCFTRHCRFPNLTEAESALYSGAGWKLARFVDGALAELYDPRVHVEWKSDVQAVADATAAAADPY